MSYFKKEYLDYFTDKENLVVFDIGSYDGYDSRYFREWLPSARIFAFEASSKNFRGVVANTQHYNVTPVNIALSDKVGTITFNDTFGKYLGSGSILEPTEAIFTTFVGMDFRPETVETKTIELFCQENNLKKVDILHMDVQGAEHLVIKGIGSFRPKLVFMETCEYPFYNGAGTFEELHSYMENLGYELVERMDMDSLFVLKE